ncbi:unnamed protein product, partial [Symbiodinium microadriaticum]
AQFPRSGEALGDVVRVLLKTNKAGKTSEADINTLLHQATVRREVVIQLILDMRRLGHPAYQVRASVRPFRKSTAACGEHGERIPPRRCGDTPHESGRAYRRTTTRVHRRVRGAQARPVNEPSTCHPLLPDGPPSPAGTISDTLDEYTLYASPEAPVQSGEATPGRFTPPQSPQRDAALPWQDRRRPHHQRGRANLAGKTGRVSPATLLRRLCAAAGCEDVEVGALAAEADGLEPAAA